MNFAEAMVQYFNGKKIRGAGWYRSHYLSKELDTMTNLLSLSDPETLEDTFWELYEEPDSYEDAVQAIMRETEEKLKALRAREGCE